jgi:hypothetical protein
MKRCPQCEFIYEDDQSLCDMDGVLLVLDTRNLPNFHALATVPPPPAPPQQRRNRVVPVFASLTLALVLGLVYYVSTQPKAVQNAYTPADTATTSSAVPEVVPTPEAQPSASQAPVVEEPKPEPTKQPAAVPDKKTPVKATSKAASSTTSKTSVAPKKEDSKVGSILKKTGRILKKPFKF